MKNIIIDDVEYTPKNENQPTYNISDDASIAANYIGKFVIVRSRNEGLNAGIVVACDKTGVELKDCRRLWYHKPADSNMTWYEGVARSGLSDDSKVSEIIIGKMIIEDYSMTICSKIAQKTIMEKKSHGQ